MSDTIQKIGFDAGAAISGLTKFNNGLLLVGLSLTRFVKTAKQVNSARFDDGLKKFVPTAASVAAAWNKIGTAATKSGVAQEAASKKGKGAANSMLLSWQTFGRILQTQVFLRGLNLIKQAFAEATNKAREFGLSIEEIQTIAGNALGTSDILANSIHNVANELGVTSQQMAEGVYQTLSNQVGNASEAMGVLVDAQKLATITGSSTAAAVNAISSVLNSYGMAASESAHVSDVLFKTVELGRLRLEDFANVLGRVLPLTAELGISFEEVSAAIATMTRQGVKADTAITQLRAVTQKLIKPTEKMAALFHKWGVQDGKQALQTFGGLYGVLKKLAKETDNNSTEMATYFNRVRAIVGQMGVMSERGQRMAATMKSIKNATGVAATAWERFTRSDAHQLTKTMNEFNNELTKSGGAAMWLAQVWNQYKINWLVNVGEIIDGFSNVSDATKDLKANLTDIADGTADAIAEAAAQIHVVTQEELDKLLAYERLHIAEMQKIWNVAADNVGDSMGRMIQGVRGSLENMTSGLKDALKPITDLAKGDKGGKGGLASSIMETEKELAKATEATASKRLTKFQQIDKKIAQSLLKSSQASRAYAKGMTDDQLAIAKGMAGVAKEAATEAQTLAKASGNKYMYRKATANLKTVLEKELRSKKNIQKLRKEATPQAKLVEAALAKEVKKRQALTTQISKQVKALSEATTPAEESAIRKRLDTLTNELTTFNMPEMTQKLLDAFDMEALPQQIKAKFLDQAFTIQAEVKLDLANTQKQLDAANLKIKQRLDPTGKKEMAAFAVLDREMNKRESFTEYLNSAEEEAVTTIKTQTKIQSELNGLVEEEADKRKAVNEIQEAFNKTSETRLKPVRAQEAWLSKTGPVGPEYDMGTLISKALDGIGPIKKLGELYGAYNDQLARNEPLTDAQIATFGVYAQKVRDSNTATEHEISLADSAESAIASLSATKLKIQDKDDLFDNTALGKSKALMGEVRSDMDRTKDAMQLLKDQTAAIAENTGTFATKANDALSGTEGLVTGWNNVAGAVKTAADAAVQAIAQVAAAKAAAASAAFHGGIQRLAAGGLAQGQDTINAVLAPGEFVSSAATTRKFYSELNAMNNGGQPVYREQGGSVTTVGDVNVTVQGGDSSQQTVREIGRSLQREIKRGTLKLN